MHAAPEDEQCAQALRGDWRSALCVVRCALFAVACHALYILPRLTMLTRVAFCDALRCDMPCVVCCGAVCAADCIAVGAVRCAVVGAVRCAVCRGGRW